MYAWPLATAESVKVVADEARVVYRLPFLVTVMVVTGLVDVETELKPTVIEPPPIGAEAEVTVISAGAPTGWRVTEDE